MNSTRLPAAVGPYSMGKQIRFQNGSVLAFTSGQLGLDPKTNQLIADDVQTQAEQAFLNLKNLVEDNGFDLERHTVKNVLYLGDMNDFALVNEVYKRYFKADFPARTCIAVKELPKGAKVEIESVLFKTI